MQERPYLSIGEVLGLLLEEFPDVTISKIRFLESQGLIDPERTASGYRKFYDNDVDLLRVILREQRENFLPLRVIRDRLESGAIEDPTGPTTPPRGIRHQHPNNGDGHGDPTGEELLPTSVDAPERMQPPADVTAAIVVPRAAAVPGAEPPPRHHRHDSFAAGDLCQLAGLTE